MSTTPGDGANWFRDGLRSGELRVAACAACGAVVEYAARCCPACGSPTLAWRAASGHGRLRAVVEISVSYDTDHLVPYRIASVALDEGPHLMARYEEDERIATDGQHRVIASARDGCLCFRRA